MGEVRDAIVGPQSRSNHIQHDQSDHKCAGLDRHWDRKNDELGIWPEHRKGNGDTEDRPGGADEPTHRQDGGQQQ
jgi:hypothetical protein